MYMLITIVLLIVAGIIVMNRPRNPLEKIEREAIEDWNELAKKYPKKIKPYNN